MTLASIHCCNREFLFPLFDSFLFRYLCRIVFDVVSRCSIAFERFVEKSVEHWHLILNHCQWYDPLNCLIVVLGSCSFVCRAAWRWLNMLGLGLLDSLSMECFEQSSDSNWFRPLEVWLLLILMPTIRAKFVALNRLPCEARTATRNSGLFNWFELGDFLLDYFSSTTKLFNLLFRLNQVICNKQFFELFFCWFYFSNSWFKKKWFNLYSNAINLTV